jgi:hypothetical protein
MRREISRFFDRKASHNCYSGNFFYGISIDNLGSSKMKRIVAGTTSKIKNKKRGN